MISACRTVDQLSYRLVCQTLRGVLQERVAAGRVGSVACRAVAALYVLLLEHHIDGWGRCSSCRRPEAVFGRRRRRCRVHRVAHYWLHQPRTTLPSTLASELGLSVPPPPAPAPDRPGLIISNRSKPDARDNDTTPLPQVEAEPGHTGPDPQTPAGSPSPRSQQ